MSRTKPHVMTTLTEIGAWCDSELARTVSQANPVATELLSVCGAAPPDTNDEFNRLLDECVSRQSGYDVAEIALAAEGKLGLDLGGFLMASHRAAYALGVAVGVRLAGGAR